MNDEEVNTINVEDVESENEPQDLTDDDMASNLGFTSSILENLLMSEQPDMEEAPEEQPEEPKEEPKEDPEAFKKEIIDAVRAEISGMREMIQSALDEDEEEET